MSKYIIEGGKALHGEIDIKGAKNSVLPLLSACILTNQNVVLHNCPNISDVHNMIKIMEYLGCKIKFENNDIVVDSSNICCEEIPQDLAKEMRSSIFLLGALLSRLNKAKVSYPGGCDIGMRPIDIHLAGLRALGIDIKEQGGYIYCNSANKKPAEIVLDLPSVGATENLIMASVFIKGRTIIKNCAREPEIVDLEMLINKMGGKVYGAGTSVIVIDGVNSLHGVEHIPIPDRIVAGTYLIGAVMCGGKLQLNNVNSSHISSLLSKLSKSSCKIDIKNDKIIVESNTKHKSWNSIETMFYPGFPTDLQTQALVLQSISEGTCVIVENIFETRFKPVVELKKMGADITVKDRVAFVKGVPNLFGANVSSTDLRGGASLVLAGLVAKGETIIEDIYHIDRGYEDMAPILSNLGAEIKRIE